MLFLKLYGKSLIVLFIILFSLFSPFSVHAQVEIIPTQQTLKAKIIKVLDEKEIEFEGKNQVYQKLELSALDGSKTFIVEHGALPSAHSIRYSPGDQVMVLADKDPDGKDIYFISDFIRTNILIVLAAIFVCITAFVGRSRGISAILGLLFSFVVIFKYLLPQILSGANPTLAAVSASLIIVPVTFYLAHGANKKTTIAIGSTFLALVVTAILAGVFVGLSKLTGFASEEAGFLQVAKQGSLNIQGLILAGIIISSLGILDDITISQAAIIEKLSETAKLSFRELFSKGMAVGHDHIASMVNTLVLVYAGASMPLLLLFIDNPHPISEILNYEIVAEEIIKTLLGSIGLVTAVPITTAIASWYFQKDTSSSPFRKHPEYIA